MAASPIKTLFLDIGGVLLTNGWDRHARRAAAKKFGIDHEEMEERHHLTFAIYEIGHMTLGEYLRRAVFYQKRDFSFEEFRLFMFSLSQPYPEAIGLMQELKERNSLRVAAVSNEGRELTQYRIASFGLDSICDFFVTSSFVGMRKPDANMFRLALDLANTAPEQAAYVDDRPALVESAAGLGFNGVVHFSTEQTRHRLAELGIS